MWKGISNDKCRERLVQRGLQRYANGRKEEDGRTNCLKERLSFWCH